MVGYNHKIFPVGLLHHLPLLSKGHPDVVLLLALDVIVAAIHSVSPKGVGKVSALSSKLTLVSQLAIA